MQPPTNPTFSPVVAAQDAITQMLRVYEPAFLVFGQSIFMAIAAILVAWYGLRMMFTQDSLGDKVFHFAKLLLLLSFGYTMVFFYERPIPGFGVSFSNLITDQTKYLADIIDARALYSIQSHFDDLFSRFEEPDAWSIIANLLYWLLLLVVGFTKFIAVAVVTFGLIASSICALLGPLFVPFFCCPGLDFLFWGWLKSFLSYSFMPVVAYAYLYMYERFIYAYLTTLPPYIPQDDYTLYIMQVLMVLFTFVFGAWLIPSLTASIFSGQSGESIFSMPSPTAAIRSVVKTASPAAS
jgi:hypothetical protein